MKHRYASHHLRLGDYICSYPVITLDTDGKILQLVVLTEELERMEFVDGTIRITLPEYPEDTDANNTDELQRIDIHTMRQLIMGSPNTPQIHLPQ